MSTSKFNFNHLSALVKLARDAVEKFIIEDKFIDISNFDRFGINYGVFVTIYKIKDKNNELRGCIGHILPTMKLHSMVMDVAIRAATEDPRFLPININELRDIIFEISLIKKPNLLNVNNKFEYFDLIVIGRHGLILDSKYGMGVLLPQVAIEYKWNTLQYLSNLCLKTGAPYDAWLLPDSKIFSFETINFKEKEPNGIITGFENTI